MSKPSYDSIADGIQKCIKSAERYYQAAEKLETSETQIAYLLYMYSLEEGGKVPLIANMPFYLDSEENLNNWKKRFFDHAEKFWFSKNIDSFLEGAIPSSSDKKFKVLAKEKLSVAYVNYKEGIFASPSPVSSEELEEIKGDAKKRLSYLQSRHTFEKDRVILKESYEKLKNMSMEDLREYAARLGVKVQDK